MQKWLTVVFLLILCGDVFSQTLFSTRKHDFGNLTSESPRYVDITVKNNEEAAFKIFSIRKPNEITSLISKNNVAPDSTSTIRFQVNPKKTGPFSYDIEVYTSNQNEATHIKLQGNLLEFYSNGNHLFTACPTFSEKPRSRDPQAFKLTVVTVDKFSREKLSESSVSLIQKGVEIWTLLTNKKGEIKQKASLGRSYFVAKHIGYKPVEVGHYINFKRNLIVLEMEQDSSSLKEESFIIKEELKIGELNIAEDTLEKSPFASIALNDSIHNNFKEERFNAINVVFILDISSSMRQADKLELMKYSLMQLSEMLRPQDKIGIVSYASNSQVVLTPSSGNSLEKIQSQIQNLEAKGFTSGSKGIKLGYETAEKARIAHGANHVIIITDGAFNQDSKAYLKHIKKYKRKGITLSVVGIKSKAKEELELKSVAKLGGGRYVSITQLSEAEQNLKREIKTRALNSTSKF